MIQKPRGTRDFLPDEMEARRSTEAKMREATRRFGYREVCTPEFEDLELFTLRSGEGIMQEMYVFEDKGGRKLALRPEITAAVNPDVHQRSKSRAKTAALVLLCRLFR